MRTYEEDSFREKNAVDPEDSWLWIQSLFIVDFKFQDLWNFETHRPSYCLIAYVDVDVDDVLMLNMLMSKGVYQSPSHWDIFLPVRVTLYLIV